MALADFENGQRVVLTAQQSTVVVETRFDTTGIFIPAFTTVWRDTELAITKIALPPRLGQTQLIEISFSPINHPYGANYKGLVTIALHDKAFEEFNVFGQRKTLEDKAKDKRAQQGEF